MLINYSETNVYFNRFESSAMLANECAQIAQIAQGTSVCVCVCASADWCRVHIKYQMTTSFQAFRRTIEAKLWPLICVHDFSLS